jgi:hypothetical protein
LFPSANPCDLVNRKAKKPAAFKGSSGSLMDRIADATRSRWDVASTDLLEEIKLSTDDGAKALAFIEGDRHLMATTASGPIRIFTLDDTELIDIGRNRLVRGFTDTECDLYFPNSECPAQDEIGR